MSQRQKKMKKKRVKFLALVSPGWTCHSVFCFVPLCTQRKIGFTRCRRLTRNKQRRCWKRGPWNLWITTNTSYRAYTRRVRALTRAISCRRSSGTRAASWSPWIIRRWVSQASYYFLDGQIKQLCCFFFYFLFINVTVNFRCVSFFRNFFSFSSTSEYLLLLLPGNE